MSSKIIQLVSHLGVLYAITELGNVYRVTVSGGDFLTYTLVHNARAR